MDGERTMKTSPIEWFEKEFCKKCKTKTCQPVGSMVYTDDPNKKILCLLSLGIMLNIDRTLVKKLKKDRIEE